MQLAQLGIINTFVNRSTDTTPDGEQLFFGLGDSNMDGRGVSVPTISSGMLYHWNGSSFDEITNQAITNDGTTGSVYQYFAEDYFATTGYKVLVVNSGKGGSTYYADGGDHWDGTPGAGDLWTPALAECRAALAAKGLTQPKAIFLNCGINDYNNGATTEANITTAMNALLDNITAEFPTVPILMLIPGRTNTVAIDQKLYNLRKLSLARAEIYPNLYPVGSAAAFIDAGYLNTGGDDIHYANAGLDAWGGMLNRWFINSAYSKWSRYVISGHFDELSSLRKGLIDTVVSGLYNRGDWFELEHLSNFRTTVIQNIGFDWTGLGYGFRTGATFGANSAITTNGTNQLFSITFFSNWNNRAASQNDFLVGVKIKTRTTAAGVTAIAFGGTNGTSAINFGQTTTNTTWRANDNTTTNGGEASVTADNLYTIGRNGTTKQLYKGTTLQASATQASTGTQDVFFRIGCNNNSGSNATFFGGTFTYAFAARNTTFDLASFFTDMEALEANWNN
jgi:hypothetical protein